MRSFAIITAIALSGVVFTHFLNRSQNPLEVQQKALNSAYQYESSVQPHRESEIGKE